MPACIIYLVRPRLTLTLTPVLPTHLTIILYPDSITTPGLPMTCPSNDSSTKFLGSLIKRGPQAIILMLLEISYLIAYLGVQASSPCNVVLLGFNIDSCSSYTTRKTVIIYIKVE